MTRPSRRLVPLQHPIGDVARNLPIITSVVARHLAQGPMAAASGVLRGLPRGVRGALIPAVSRLAPTLAALGDAASGRTAEATEALARVARAGRPAQAVRAVEALAVLHRTAEARAALEDLRLRTADGARLALVDARLLAEEGHPSRALEVLDGAPAGRARTRLVRVVTGELSVLDARARLEAGPAARRAVAGDPARVLHLVTTALPEAQTGYTIRTQGIARGLLSAGLTVDVVSRLGFPVDTGALAAPPQVRVDGVSYHRLLPARPLTWSAGGRLDETVRLVTRLAGELRPDVLHAHSKHDNAQVALAVGHATGLPVVYEVRGFLEETWRTRGGDPTSERYLRSRDAETACMVAADAVVTLADSMRAAIIARGVPAGRVHVVPNAVGDDHLVEPPSREEAREALGLPLDAVVLGFSGTVNAYEGLDVLIDAVAFLDDPRLLLLVVGSGPALGEMRSRAAALGDRVRFTGRVPHAAVRQHLAALDLSCVPRSATPVTRLVPPLKPVEALATGIPVLASDLPPLAELAAHGSFVQLAPAGDVAAWAREITWLTTDLDALRSAGAAGREWACRNRTWGRLAEEYRVIYREAARGRR